MTPDEWRDEYERIFIKPCNERIQFDGSVPCAYARREGLEEPWHPNVWVAMLHVMKKRGYVTKVQAAVVPGSSNHSHNMYIGLWLSNIFKGIQNG